MTPKLIKLKEELSVKKPVSSRKVSFAYMYEGYVEHFDDEVPVAKAYAIASIFTKHKKYVYDNDMVAGSVRGLIDDSIEQSYLNHAAGIVGSYGLRSFWTNADHYAADYDTFLQDGIKGTLEKIQKSRVIHAQDVDFKKKKVFLDAAEITMRAFSEMIMQYAEAALEKVIVFL